MESPTGALRLAAAIACVSALQFATVPGTGWAAEQEAQAKAQREAQGRAIMMKMAQFLATTPRFRVNLRSGYDAVQASGQKIEFQEARGITVQRPARLRVEGTRSDGAKVLTVFTGKEIILVDHASKVYASAPQPGTLDETVVYFVRDLGMRLPLAAMLLSRLPAELQERIQSVEYVELTKVNGAASHHIAARANTVDVQMWVADGAQPLPQRVVLTYKKEPGQPQFRADFSNWNLAPDVSDTVFAAQPQGMQKIAFAARLPRSPAAAKKGEGAKGGK